MSNGLEPQDDSEPRGEEEAGGAPPRREDRKVRDAVVTAAVNAVAGTVSGVIAKVAGEALLRALGLK